MIYYKHPVTNEVYAYETEAEREQFGAAELVPMAPEEIEAHLNPPASPTLVPSQVTRAQGKVVLIQMGLWPQVLAFVDAIEDPIEKAVAEVAINDTVHWQRNSPFLNQAATALGISQEQMDQLFIQASQVLL
jgi:hypothetical protein